MRRAFAAFVWAIALSLSASTAFGQYPYPYPPMPVSYPPPYGYPAPMPAYAPNARPMYIPAPMRYPSPPAQNVLVYGPLTDGPITARPPNPYSVAPGRNGPAAATGIRQVQAEVHAMPGIAKNELPPEACGAACGDFPDSCGANCAPPRWDRPIRGHGHFIGEVAAYFLAPFPSSRFAYNTTTVGGSATTDFPTTVVVGERATVGYVCHTGWGVRGGFTNLNGVASQAVNNTVGSGALINTPFPLPFAIVSPSPGLAAGIGVDQFDFKQRIQMNIADIEILKESHFLDTTFLFSVGSRYARLMQSYTATRSNPGGAGAGLAVLLDRQDLDSSSYFQGWGPTVSLEVVHPIVCGFSVYANARGSFLFGTDRFVLNRGQQLRTVNGAGVVTFLDASNTTTASDSRVDSSVEAEAGVQFGYRIRRCYLYSRAGAVYQRWWDVGTPTTANGNLQFVGGVVRAGISY